MASAAEARERAKLLELTLKLGRLEKLPKKELRKILRDGATIIWKDMVARIPVDSGDLKKAMSKKAKTVKAGKRSRSGVSFSVQMPERSLLPQNPEDVTWYYPAAVEFGSRPLGRRNARPFMRPAFDAKRAEVLRLTRTKLAAAIKAEGRRGVR